MAEKQQAEGASSPQEAEFNEWLLHPVTKRLFKRCEERLQDLKDDWANGKFSAERTFLMEQRNAKAIGQCEVLTGILDVEFTDLYEEFEGGTKSGE